MITQFSTLFSQWEPVLGSHMNENWSWESVLFLNIWEPDNFFHRSYIWFSGPYGQLGVLNRDHWLGRWRCFFKVTFRGTIIKRAWAPFFSTSFVIFVLFTLFLLCAHYALVLLLALLVLLVHVGATTSRVGVVVTFWCCYAIDTCWFYCFTHWCCCLSDWCCYFVLVLPVSSTLWLKPCSCSSHIGVIVCIGAIFISLFNLVRPSLLSCVGRNLEHQINP
jgi:hypothetical protein